MFGNKALKEKAIPELTKAPVVIPDLKAESHKLSHIAASKLGYMGKVAIETTQKPGPLAFVLKSLDIHVYDEEKVRAYQKKVVASKQKEEDAKNGGYENGYKISFSWETSRIREFRENIPDAVLQLACDISDRVRNIDFQVEYLQRNRTPLPDPFLVVQHGDERYYIAVWDEKDFERENA